MSHQQHDHWHLKLLFLTVLCLYCFLGITVRIYKSTLLVELNLTGFNFFQKFRDQFQMKLCQELVFRAWPISDSYILIIVVFFLWKKSFWFLDRVLISFFNCHIQNLFRRALLSDVIGAMLFNHLKFNQEYIYAFLVVSFQPLYQLMKFMGRRNFYASKEQQLQKDCLLQMNLQSQEKALIQKLENLRVAAIFLIT